MVEQQKFQIQAIQELISKFDADEEESDESNSDASASGTPENANGDA